MNEINSDQTNDGNSLAEAAQVIQHVPKYARLAWVVVKDPDLTGKQRAVLMAAVGYSLSPIDAIPGIIPVIGQMDDLAVIIFALRWVLRSMPEDKSDRYLSQADLTIDILDDDLQLLQRSGVRILKKAKELLGKAAVGAWGLGKSIIDKAK